MDKISGLPPYGNAAELFLAPDVGSLVANGHEAAPSFEELVAAAGFTAIGPQFGPGYETTPTPGLTYKAMFQGLVLGTWVNKGDHVRGRFEIIALEGSTELSIIKEYTLEEAQAKAAEVPGRHLATAYETAAYAALGVENGKTPSDKSDEGGWNGTGWIVGLGSICTDVAYHSRYPEVASLWGFYDRRELVTVTTGYPFRPLQLVLCVVEDD